MHVYFGRTGIAAGMILAASACFNLASASTLTSADDAVFGADSVTIDSATGIKWLDLTESLGRSFNDLTGNDADTSNEFVTGGDFAGWAYATHEQVNTLFINAGLRTLAAAGGPETFTGSAKKPAFVAFQNLFGVTFTQVVNGSRSLIQTRGLTSTLFGTTHTILGEVRIDDKNGAIETSDDLRTEYAAVGMTATFGLGSFLIQAPSVVPVPASLLLFASALAGFGGLGFLKRRFADRTAGVRQA